MNSKKTTMKKCSSLLCILLCIAMLSGCNDIYQKLSDGTEKILNAASNAVGDKPKEAILNAFNAINEAGGKSVLTNSAFLQGNRSAGEDDYTGTYQADYKNFSDTEVIFGGTSIEREGGNTLTISCSLKIDDGEAIIFKKSGNNEPIALLKVTDDYSGTIEVGNGSNYIGIWGEDFSGSVEINIQ